MRGIQEGAWEWGTGAWKGQHDTERGGDREGSGACGTARQDLGPVMGMSMARAGTIDGKGVWEGT